MFVSCQQSLTTNAYCGLPVKQFRQRNLDWQELKKPKLDQNWKTSKPGTLTNRFTNSLEFIKAYRFKILKSLIKLRKKCFNRIIL